MATSVFEPSSEDKNLTQHDKEIGKHGLRKRILVKGNSWQTPFLGDEAEGTNFNSKDIQTISYSLGKKKKTLF